MSQNPTALPTDPPASAAVGASAQPRYGAQYRRVSWVAVASVVCGALSFVTVFGWWFLVVPLAGVILGFNARQQIRELPSELTGMGLASAGMGLSLLLGALGVGGFIAYEMREVPFGYELVTFADLQPAPANKNARLPIDIDELDGKRIFIKGFIYPGKQTIAIKRFIFVPTIGHCNFCSSQLKSTEMLACEMAGDMRTNFKQRMIGIGGRLKVDRTEAAKPFGGFPYQMEVDYVR